MNHKYTCKSCTGNKTTKERKILEIHVEKGMEEGHKITFRGEGDQEPDVEPGDVVIVLIEKKHDVFQRKDQELIMEMDIDLVDALCGFKRSVNTLDDREIIVTAIPGEIIKHGDVKMIRGEGMPYRGNPFEKGNLIIKVSRKLFNFRQISLNTLFCSHKTRFEDTNFLYDSTLLIPLFSYF